MGVGGFEARGPGVALPLQVEGGAGFGQGVVLKTGESRDVGLGVYIELCPETRLGLLFLLKPQISAGHTNGWQIGVSAGLRAVFQCRPVNGPGGYGAVQVATVCEFLYGKASTGVARFQPGSCCDGKAAQARYRPTDQGPVF